MATSARPASIPLQPEDFHEPKHLLLIVMMILAAPAMAQIANGDFEIPGGMGWTAVNPPLGGLFFPATGGNPDGFAEIRAAGDISGAVGYFTQIFNCGDDPSGTCLITLDDTLAMEIGPVGSGFVQIRVDGILLYESPAAEVIDWTTVEVNVPCGTHDLQLGLFVSEVGAEWTAGFDNVSATCEETVPAEEIDWSTVKGLY